MMSFKVPACPLKVYNLGDTTNTITTNFYKVFLLRKPLMFVYKADTACDSCAHCKVHMEKKKERKKKKREA